jgi:hypothetical protein
MTKTVHVPSAIRMPEINMSAIPISGDAAGLVFALGSVAILLGMPGFASYFLLSLGCGTLVAAALVAVHAAGRSPASRNRTLDLR